MKSSFHVLPRLLTAAWLLSASGLAAAPAVPVTIVAFGDSATTPRDTLVVYADILRQELCNARVLNAGYSGDTTEMARARFDKDALVHKPPAWPCNDPDALPKPLCTDLTPGTPHAVVDRIPALLADKSRPLTWVFTGDSITHGAKHTHGSRSYVEHFAERIRWEMGRGQDVVVNTGLSGDRADGLLQNFDSRVARFKPDVVSIMIGMNDCTRGPEKREGFRNNLRQLVTRTRALGAVPVLHTQNTVEPAAAKERGDLPAYAALVAEVAREQQVVLVDHWQHWQTACHSPELLKQWLNDPIHPNARGHRELAILTFRILGIYSTNSPTCRP